MKRFWLNRYFNTFMVEEYMKGVVRQVPKQSSVYQIYDCLASSAHINTQKTCVGSLVVLVVNKMTVFVFEDMVTQVTNTVHKLSVHVSLHLIISH